MGQLSAGRADFQLPAARWVGIWPFDPLLWDGSAFGTLSTGGCSTLFHGGGSMCLALFCGTIHLASLSPLLGSLAPDQ